MITKEKYLKALDVIEKYQKQNKEKGITVKDFTKMTELPTRLYNTLNLHFGEDETTLLSDLSSRALMRYKWVGKKTITEFEEAKEKLLK